VKTGLFVLPQNIAIQKSLRDYKGIAYLNASDLSILKLIMVSLDIEIPLIQLETKDVNISQVPIFILSSLKNPMLYEIFDKNNSYNFIDYAELLNLDIIWRHIPFLRKKTIVISDYFKHPHTSVISTLTIDMCLWGHKELEENTDLLDHFDIINKKYQINDVINFYTQYFNFFRQTEEYIQTKNTLIKDRALRPILEQFHEET
jgi:hypothetical protein